MADARHFLRFPVDRAYLQYAMDPFPRPTFLTAYYIQHTLQLT
jgi:hypothetical protein